MMKKVTNPFGSTGKKCWFLLGMSYLTFGLLLLLNLYIVYDIASWFRGDGWSFMGGLIVAMSFIITIPAFILSGFSIRLVRDDNSKKYYFPLVLGIIGIVAGFILNNATGWWIYMVLFSVLLIISVLVCREKKQEAPVKERENTLTTDNVKTPLVSEKEHNASNKTYKFVMIFQIIGLVLLFVFTISSAFISRTPDGYNKYNEQIISMLTLGFLFLLHGIVTIAFVKKKKWALNFKYIESYILLAVSVLIFASALITEGFSLSKNFLLIVSLFIFLILLLVYLIISYKGLKKSKLFFLCFVAVFSQCFFSSGTLSAQETGKMQELFLLDQNSSDYAEFVSSDIKDLYHPGEAGKYPSINLFDGFFKTCWVAGADNPVKTAALYIKIPSDIPVKDLILNIFSGYGKSKALYLENARPEKLKISVFAAFYPDGFSTETASLYLIKKSPYDQTIKLADTFGVQSFPLNLNSDELINFQKESLNECSSFSGENYKKLLGDTLISSFTPALIIKIEITDTYKGSKYDDVCISEIFFNDRFVTAYPDKYYQIDNVYIKNDNALLMDYANNKGVVIYKDTSSVFSMVDWPEFSNWAILHYIPDDEVGPGSIEENYFLIDLKNRKIVNTEFRKCTGISDPYLLLKDKSGRIFTDTEEFKVELK